MPDKAARGLNFEERDGRLYAVKGAKELDLGPAEAARESMARHLEQVDFGER